MSKKRRVVTVQPDGKTKISRGALTQGGYQYHDGQQQKEEGEETKRICSHCHTVNAKRWYEQRQYHHRNNNNNKNDSNEKQKLYLICKYLFKCYYYYYYLLIYNIMIYNRR